MNITVLGDDVFHSCSLLFSRETNLGLTIETSPFTSSLWLLINLYMYQH